MFSGRQSSNYQNGYWKYQSDSEDQMYMEIDSIEQGFSENSLTSGVTHESTVPTTEYGVLNAGVYPQTYQLQEGDFPSQPPTSPPVTDINVGLDSLLPFGMQQSSNYPALGHSSAPTGHWGFGYTTTSEPELDNLLSSVLVLPGSGHSSKQSSIDEKHEAQKRCEDVRKDLEREGGDSLKAAKRKGTGKIQERSQPVTGNSKSRNNNNKGKKGNSTTKVAVARAADLVYHDPEAYPVVATVDRLFSATGYTTATSTPKYATSLREDDLYDQPANSYAPADGLNSLLVKEDPEWDDCSM